MLGDILLIRDMHKSAAEAIAKKVIIDREKKPKGYRYIVAISGESGAGKSEVSHSLALQLKQEHIRVKVMHTDNYYKVPPLLRPEWRRTKGIETVGTDEYDWNLIHRNIQDFKEERESMMPCIDIIPEQVDKIITDFKKIDMLVIDGLYALKADGIDMRVFIDLTYHETKISQIVRGKEKMDDFRTRVLEREHLNVRSLKPLADYIIDKSYQVVDPKTGEFI
jgi:uridine kinase